MNQVRPTKSSGMLSNRYASRLWVHRFFISRQQYFNQITHLQIGTRIADDNNEQRGLRFIIFAQLQNGFDLMWDSSSSSRSFARQAEAQQALLRIASLRYQEFYERFGREPEPDEPLFFDPAHNEPTLADHRQTRIQVLTAASLANVDAKPVLELLGLD